MAVGANGVAQRKMNGLALVFLEEPVLGDDSGIVVLLDDAEGRLGGWAGVVEIAENDGVGLELGGDLVGGDFVEAAMKVEIDGGARDGEVLVVNGEGGGGRAGWSGGLGRLLRGER